MAFTEFYCQSGGSNLNAGSTTDDTAPYAFTAGTWVSTTRILTVGSTTGVTVGMWISIYTSGATVTGYVARISAVTSTTITTEANYFSGTKPANGTYDAKVGGAWKGPNAASGFPINFFTCDMLNSSLEQGRCNFKDDAEYSITAQITANIAPVNNSGSRRFEGYTSTPGDGGFAVINGGTSGAAYRLLAFGTNNYYHFKNFELKNNGATGSANGLEFTSSGKGIIENICVHDVRGIGFSVVSGGTQTFINCEAYACTNHGFSTVGNVLINCISHENTGASTDGFSGYGTFVGCISDTNGRYGFATTLGATYLNCDSYNNTSHGFYTTVQEYNLSYLNCNSVKNGGYGLFCSAQHWPNLVCIGIGFGSGTQANTSGTVNTNLIGDIRNSVTYPSNQTPWNAPTTGDFSITLAEAVNAGISTYTQKQAGYSGTTAYNSLGAAQPEASTGGGGGLGITKSRLFDNIG